MQTDMAIPPIRETRILCLGISEPDAGCDVAGITTRGVRDEDDYVIDGRENVHHHDHRAHAIVRVTK
ncbi:MAG: acyl-CoA dehydrogenase, partial [Solirubrobacteraceae bacterium]